MVVCEGTFNERKVVCGDTNHGGDRFGVVGTQIMWERAIGCILIVVCGDTNHGEASAAADSFSFSFCNAPGQGW
jgi:hypothetical protein